MIRLGLPVLLALTLGASVAGAQVPARLAGRRVMAVRIEGETSGATSADDVGVTPGVPLSRALVRETTLRLLADGRWADVQIDAVVVAGGVDLVVLLTPRILIERIDVSGNEAMSDEDVRSTITLGPDGELEGAELQGVVDSVAAEYAERGFVDARVRVRLRDTDDPTRKILRVIVDEQEPLRVLGFTFPEDRPPEGFDLSDALGLAEGDVVDQARLTDGVAQARIRLRDAGYLESRISRPTVHRASGGADIEVALHLGPEYTVRIVGHEPLQRTTVEEALELGDHRLQRRTLEALRVRVVELFQRHGYRDAEVVLARFRGDEEGTVVLEVQIEPGRPLSVVGISFPGAAHFETGYLRSQVVSVLEEELPDTRLFAPVDSDLADRLGLGGRSEMSERRSTARPLEVDPSRVFYAPLYETAREHLREVYEQAGFLSARIGDVRLSPVGRGRTVVVIPVFEGPRTLLFDVTLRGNSAVSSRDLLATSQLRRGEPFSHLGLDESLRRMTDLYRERGYLYARIDADVRFSQNRERAEVVLDVVERFEVRVGAITLEGNERATDGVIRDALRIREGEIFRPSAVRHSQDALMALGIFTSVTIAPRDPDLAERVKPIVVTVHERMPQYFDFQLGISTGQGLRSSFEYAYRNLFGYALGFTFRAQLGLQFFFQDPQLQQNISGLPVLDRLERRITATLALPQIGGLPNVRATLDLVHLRDNQRAFGLDKNGVALSFTWRPDPHVSLVWSAQIEHNGVTLFGGQTIDQILMDAMGNPQITRLLRVPEGDSAVVSSRVAATVDERDSSFVPTEGWYAVAGVEWARSVVSEAQDDGPAPVMHILKLTGTLNGYVPIDDVVLAFQGRVGGIVPLEPGQTTFANRQFFLGGVDTLRGFNQDQLQPQDLAEVLDPATATILRGSEFFYLVRAEFRFPIYAAFHGALFTDLGNHWADPSSITLDENFVRPTAGAGVRIVTPVGPLAIDVGFNLLQRTQLNEPLAAFHFSLGVF
ncbi:MAG: BamA/TamA family outer membrane protein [Sandaracinaceae bacterium]|nr:BamA/TamA family outer membrane protein [Sandaracinaceae bacterium]